MNTKKDFDRAAAICNAIDKDVRGRVVDAFCDFFRGENPRFDVTRFCDACDGYKSLPAHKRLRGL